MEKIKKGLKEAHKIHGQITEAKFITGHKTGYAVWKVTKRSPKRGYKSKYIDF